MDVAFERVGDVIWLRYVVECPVQFLILGEPKSSERADGLWHSTCFELFIRSMCGNTAYVEYNFAPDTRWAAYAFSDYRSASRNLLLARTPEIELDAGENWLALEVEAEIPADWRNTTIQIGLSAVIEEKDGTKSYWALAHPAGNPDFHHPDCFALTLAAPDGP